MKHVEGKHKKKKVVVYALSTCIWCKKTKKLLKDLEVCYDYEDVDLLSEEEREEIESVMDGWGGVSFPLIVVDDKHAIHGYDEEAVKKKIIK
jgi:glutaredoxin-like protein NrdH